MAKRAIKTDKAPTPTGPFNQAIRIGNLVFTSGQAGRNRETGKMGDIRDQAARCIANIEAILAEAGATLADIVKVTVHMRNVEDAEAFNEVYRKLMPEPLPARSAAYVGLRFPDMLCEMEAIAVIPDERAG
jgi:2-iminobutanoate/2-iminopropanoate deaminase